MKIFISYRRADSIYVVDRIRERLIEAYDEEAVFRDLESIQLGQNFSVKLQEITTNCDVMLVVIGPQWAGIQDEEGHKRLFEPNDYTRIEVENGLANKHTLVIPVLVMAAKMPKAEELPASLVELRFRNAINIRYGLDFEPDLQRLIDGINAQFPSAYKPKPTPKKERKPMDPVTLAATATSLLVPFISKIGEKTLDKIADQLPDKIGAVWNGIWDRMKAKPDAATDLIKNAEDTDNQEAFTLQLKKMLKEDEAFSSLLTDLIEDAKKSESGINIGGDGVVATNGSIGNAFKVGGNISGSTINISSNIQSNDNPARSKQ